jgi:ELWxxDGT repeat protein
MLVMAMAGKIDFGASDGTNGVMLWTSDGTPVGAERVKNLNPQE